MNKEEYWLSKSPTKTAEYKIVHQKLKEWKMRNNITERCIIHHRDDTEECIKYNDEHYERWGIDDNGNFIEGKYVLFMTCREHCAYHHTGDKHYLTGNGDRIKGEKNPFWGKRHTDETKRIIGLKSKGRNTFKGKHHTDEAKMKNRIAHLGKHPTDEAKMKNRAANTERMQIVSNAYKEYKLNGGTLKWNDFQKQYNSMEALNINIYNYIYFPMIRFTEVFR